MSSRAQNVLNFRRVNMHGTLSGPNADPDYHEKYHPGTGKAKPKVDKKGDCFENTARHITLFNELENKTNMRLVHGWVVGTGGDIVGVRYPHAWLEYDVPLPEEWVKLFPGMQPVRMAMDLTTDERVENPFELPADLYRHYGNASVTAEYTPTEARRLAVETGHWGPWDKELLEWYPHE